MLTLLNKILLVESHCVSHNLNWDTLSAGSNPFALWNKMSLTLILDSTEGNGFHQEVWLLAILHLLSSDGASKFSFFYLFVKWHFGCFHFITSLLFHGHTCYNLSVSFIKQIRWDQIIISTFPGLSHRIRCH